MKKENKWPLLLAALVMMAISWADTDMSALRELQPQALTPVLIITVAVFLLKTGILTAVLLALKKTWNWIKNKIKSEKR